MSTEKEIEISILPSISSLEDNLKKMELIYNTSFDKRKLLIEKLEVAALNAIDNVNNNINAKYIDSQMNIINTYMKSLTDNESTIHRKINIALKNKELDINEDHSSQTIEFLKNINVKLSSIDSCNNINSIKNDKIDKILDETFIKTDLDIKTSELKTDAFDFDNE